MEQLTEEMKAKREAFRKRMQAKGLLPKDAEKEATNKEKKAENTGFGNVFTKRF